MSAYRELAKVLPLYPEPVDLNPMMPFHKMSSCDGQLYKPRQASDSFTYYQECSVCGCNTVYAQLKLCRGKKVGMCKKVICAETRPHFHVRCKTCDTTWVMATKQDLEQR